MSRRLSLDHVLALVSLLWLFGLACLPALNGVEEVFYATAILVAYNFVASVWTFLRVRQVLVATNAVQFLLFGLLSYQLAQAFGDGHYRFERDPCLYDWAEFALAHLIRATDLLDVLDEYGIHLQAIHHASIEAGIILVCLHVSTDLFLLSLLGRWAWQCWKRVGPSQGTSLQRGRRGCAILMLAGVILATYTLYALMQQWPSRDWWLWPLDNVLRLLDIGDVMQIFQLRLHQVEMDNWTCGYALAFRFAAGLYLAHVIPWVRLWGFNGHWYTFEELMDFLHSDEAAFRAVAARALGGLGPAAAPAVPALQHALAHDPSLMVRCRAATALGLIGRPAASAVDELARMLTHSHRPLRLRAARALGRIGPAARDALHDLAYLARNLSDDPRFNRAVCSAMYRIAPHWREPALQDDTAQGW